MEKLPNNGRFVFASNHLGVFDGPLILFVLSHSQLQQAIVVVAEKYQKHAIYRWIVKTLDFMWIDRFNSDYRTLRKTYQRLTQGGFLVIAPEGTRSPTGALIEARHGAAYLASKTQSEIFPIAITGTEDALMKIKFRRLQRLHINIKIGEPFQ
ncbi:MAG: 1-acyl-sn-glycerol-3-phosphate acyltransferase, partial [Anaerolineae bacterium]|nr:1-acyl-sn-glycerol-3-phosphate acyltransferase [Anaerolineae bacterium]